MRLSATCAPVIGEARRLAAEHDAVAARLTPHQEVHAVALVLLRRDPCRRLGGRVRAQCSRRGAGAANRDTPCQFNWRALLMAALAQAHAGDDAHARRLEQLAFQALEVGGPGGARAGAASARAGAWRPRGHRAAADREPGRGQKWDVDYAAARSDALAAVGHCDAVEREAPPALTLGGYGEPFALRALGIVRRDLHAHRAGGGRVRIARPRLPGAGDPRRSESSACDCGRSRHRRYDDQSPSRAPSRRYARPGRAQASASRTTRRPPRPCPAPTPTRASSGTRGRP